MSPKLDRFNLDGKVALITGGGGLLGVEHAIALIECGCIVVMTDNKFGSLLQSTKLLEENFPKADTFKFKMDVTDPLSIKSVIDELEKLNLFV